MQVSLQLCVITAFLTCLPPQIAKSEQAVTVVASAGHAFSSENLLRGILRLQDATLVESSFEILFDKTKRARLTLQPKLQEATNRILRLAKAPKAAAAVISLDGSLLALVGLDEQKDEPSVALTSWAPAASIFKLVTAAALLQAGIKPDMKFCYHGGIRSVDKGNLIDNLRLDTQCNDLGFAIAMSQNALIAKIAHRHIDETALREAAQHLGFLAKPDFALDADAGQLALSNDPLEFARASAGFSPSTKLSALNAALVALSIANHGQLTMPALVKSVFDGENEQLFNEKTGASTLSPEVCSALTAMMVATTTRGTARKAFFDGRGRPYLPVSVAGKTGSLSGQNPALSYSWFVGFAPADKPQVAIAVLIANRPLWHLKAHTAARMILEEIF